MIYLLDHVHQTSLRVFVRAQVHWCYMSRSSPNSSPHFVLFSVHFQVSLHHCAWILVHSLPVCCHSSKCSHVMQAEGKNNEWIQPASMFRLHKFTHPHQDYIAELTSQYLLHVYPTTIPISSTLSICTQSRAGSVHGTASTTGGQWLKANSCPGPRMAGSLVLKMAD